MAILIVRTRHPASEELNQRVSRRDLAPEDLFVELVDETTADLAEIRRDPNVRAAALPIPMALIAPVVSASSQPGDGPPGKGATGWGIKAVRADKSPWTGEGVTVAVLDTGIDKAHAAFKGMELVEEDFTGEGNGDFNGHGTHCAATIFGRNVGGARIGVARGVQRALIGKVLRTNGAGESDQIVRGIKWAAAEGANVISLSLGFDFPGIVAKQTKKPEDIRPATSYALELYRTTLRIFEALAIQVATDHPECLLVAAAGNESHRPNFRLTASPPSEVDGFLSVAAVQRRASKADPWEVWPHSNANARVAAPGVGIWSAQAGGKSGLCPLDGTSMATPHVAGVAALWAHCQRAQTGRIVGSEVWDRLRGTARLMGLNPADVGMGVVQAPV